MHIYIYIYIYAHVYTIYVYICTIYSRRILDNHQPIRLLLSVSLSDMIWLSDICLWLLQEVSDSPERFQAVLELEILQWRKHSKCVLHLAS